MSFHVIWKVVEECHFAIKIVGDVWHAESENVTILVEILKSSKIWKNKLFKDGANSSIRNL